MSKNLGKTAASAIARDIFGATPDIRFKLRPPANFDFFNSLRLVEIDSFSGVNVVLIKSVIWNDGGKATSRAQIDGSMLYSGTHEGDLPASLSIHSESYWLAVVSHQLASQGALHSAAIEGKGCLANTAWQEHFFMFLRAHELVSFDESQRLRAEEEISYQPAANGYVDTSVADLYSVYEPVAVYEVNVDSPLAGRSVFWYSYIVAENWKALPGPHVRPPVLQYLEQIYDANLWHFPIDNARIAITAAHFKHTFVDLYRCIEGLYSLPRSVLVKNELKLPMKATELARTFREKLVWRRAEQDSLRLLILDAGVQNLDLTVVAACMQGVLPPRPVVDEAVGLKQPDTEEKWHDSVATVLAKRIYGIRNQIVHQLDEIDRLEVDRISEAALIELLAQLCVVLYKRYATEF